MEINSLISLISLNSAVIENNNDNNSMLEMNFLISLISVVIENNNDNSSIVEINFSISLNSAVIENNNDNNSMVEIIFSIFLNFRFSDRGGISKYWKSRTGLSDCTTGTSPVFIQNLKRLWA